MRFAWLPWRQEHEDQLEKEAVVVPVVPAVTPVVATSVSAPRPKTSFDGSVPVADFFAATYVQQACSKRTC